MERKSILILRYAAFGDFIYTLPTLQHYFDDGWDIYFHINLKGYHLFAGDPRFKELTVFEASNFPEDKRSGIIQEIWNDLVKKYSPDVVLNLSSSLENTAIATRENSLDTFLAPVEDRRRVLKNNFFYGVPLLFANQDPYLVTRKPMATLHFADKEIAWAQRWREEHKDQFIILLPLNGTTAQKKLPQSREWVKELLERYPDAVVYLCGDGQVKPFTFGYGRIYNTIGASFRQLALMARYADFVFGPETGIVVAAGMWKTPKLMLCSASSVRQCVFPTENDFSIQAEIECSPCHRGIYAPEDCYQPYRNGLCECSYRYDKRKVMDAIETVYRTMRYRRELDGEIRNQPFHMPVVRPDFVQRPGEAGDLQPGLPGKVPQILGAALYQRADGDPLGIPPETP